jgi:hypothetical protein
LKVESPILAQRTRMKGDFWFRMFPGRGWIQGIATNAISEGGNYIVKRRYRSRDTSSWVKTLRGKATDNSTISIVEKRNPAREFVRFDVDPITGAGQRTPRSELAPREMIPFGDTVHLRLEFRVRSRQMDAVTGYVLQFWQPIISPIAGIRVKDGRLEAVTRSAGGVASAPLTRKWNQIELSFRPGDKGLFEISGALNGAVAGRIDGGSQASSALEQIYRPKFGFYGAGGGPELSVDYRRFVQWVS